MVESIRNYCKIGIVHPMLYPSTIKGEGPIFETVKSIACDPYFDGIEVTRIEDKAELEKVAKLLKVAKVAVGFAGQPSLLTQGMNINDLDESKRMAAVEQTKKSIDSAVVLGAKGVGYLSGKYEEATKEESYQALLKSTKEICEYAKPKGINIILEIFDYDIDKKSLIGPTSLAKKFAEEIKKEYSNFGLMVDLSHVPMYYESCKDSLVPIKEHLMHAHIGNTVIKNADCEAYGDMHPYFGFENGENDVEQVKEFLEVLLDIGYLNKETRPFLSFEVKPWGDDDVDAVLANAKRVLDRAWALIER